MGRKIEGGARSMAAVSRLSAENANAVVPINQSVSNVIAYDDYSGGGLITPSQLDANTLIGFKVSNTPDGTFMPLYNDQNTVVEIIVSVNRAYELPDALFGWPYFKVWCENAGVDIVQTASRTFRLALKG